MKEIKPKKIKFPSQVCRIFAREAYYVDWIATVYSKEFLKEMGVFGKKRRPPSGKGLDKCWDFRWKKGSMDKLKSAGIYI